MSPRLTYTNPPGRANAVAKVAKDLPSFIVITEEGDAVQGCSATMIAAENDR